MKLRFVASNTIVSRLIIARESIAMPFTPSHVEAVSRDGKSYVGAHIEDGIRSRPIGYDAATMTHELILDLRDAPGIVPLGDAVFHDYTEAHIGEPYDWKSIIDFALPENEHQKDHAICSAFMVLALRKCEFFRWPLAAPAHLISPRDLLLILSAQMEVPGI